MSQLNVPLFLLRDKNSEIYNNLHYTTLTDPKLREESSFGHSLSKPEIATTIELPIKKESWDS